MKPFVAILLVIVALAQADIQSRITGGTDAKSNSVKSFVAIQIEFENGIKTCGGVLGVPEDRILTAASCVVE